MPLHLLGKKSWNVYNVENIEKVRRDEAAAKAKEEEEERRMQDEDTRSRLDQLRTSTPRAPPSTTPSAGIESVEDDLERASGRRSKKRKLAGEDDTDRDIRLAKEVTAPAPSLLRRQAPLEDAALVDSNGNFSLIPESKRAKVDPVKPKKEKESEAITNMRFADAAGLRQKIETPWYSTAASKPATTLESEEVGRNVWGKEDPGRAKRDISRLNSSDPLAFMNTGVQKLRQVEKERKEWKNERLKDFDEPLSKSVTDVSKKHRRHKDDEWRRERSKHRDKYSDSERSRHSRNNDDNQSRRHKHRHKSAENYDERRSRTERV